MTDLSKDTEERTDDKGTPAAEPGGDKPAAAPEAPATEISAAPAKEPEPEKPTGEGDEPASLDDIEVFSEDEEGVTWAEEPDKPAGDDKPAGEDAGGDKPKDAAAEKKPDDADKGGGKQTANERIQQLVKERNDAQAEVTELRKKRGGGDADEVTLPEGTELIEFTTLDPDKLPEALAFKEKMPEADDFIGDDGEVQEAKYELAKAQYVEKLRGAVSTHNKGLTDTARAAGERAKDAQGETEANDQTVQKHLGRETSFTKDLDDAGKTAYTKATDAFKDTTSEHLQKFVDPVTKKPALYDPKGIVDAVVESDVSPELAQYLGQNPEIHKGLYGMSASNAMRTIRDIEIEITTGKVAGTLPKVTAPIDDSAPPNAGSGGTGAKPKTLAEIAEVDDDMEGYMEAAGTEIEPNKW